MDFLPRPVKRLFWDIETSPNVVLAFRIGFKLNIGHDQILEERKVICLAYKWEGDKNITVLRWDKNQDDRVMLSKFMKVAEQADELVAYFGDKFDVKWFRTRCLIHGLPPIPVYKTVDPCSWAFSYFAFNNAKLDYLSKLLFKEKKISTGFGLWKGVVAGCSKALNKMCDYCAHDVFLLERVFHAFKAYAPPKSHQGVLMGRPRWSCPRTGSLNVKFDKVKVTEKGTLQFQMKNADNGTYFTISQPVFKIYQLAMKKKKKKPIRY